MTKKLKRFMSAKANENHKIVVHIIRQHLTKNDKKLPKNYNKILFIIFIIILLFMYKKITENTKKGQKE